MPYPQYQFGDPAVTGYQQAAKAQMQKEQATPINFDPNQLAQQAFGPAPDAPFVPVAAQPVTQLDTSALNQPAPKSPTMIEVPEQTIQRHYDPGQKARLEKEAAAMKAAQAAELQYQASEGAVRAAAYEKSSEQFERQQQEYNQALNELKGQKLIDPMDKWGTAGKIGAAIAMGMGAYAAAFTGGRNYAVDVIDSSIKRDLQLQEAEINRLGKNVDEKKNALAFAYNRLGDIEKAKDAVYAASLAGVSDQVKDKIATMKSDKAKMHGANLEAALATKQAEAAAKTNDMIVTKTVRGQVLQPKTPENQGLETPYGMTSSKDAANTVRQKIAEHTEAREGLSAFKEVVKKYGSWNMVPSEEKGIYQGALLPVINAYRVSLNLGVLNPSERDKIESELKNKLSSKEATAFISGMERMIDMNERATKKAYIVGTPYNQKPDSAKRNEQLGFKQ